MLKRRMEKANASDGKAKAKALDSNGFGLQRILIMFNVNVSDGKSQS
jgi:hypothetical protein